MSFKGPTRNKDDRAERANDLVEEFSASRTAQQDRLDAAVELVKLANEQANRARQLSEAARYTKPTAKPSRKNIKRT
jgi:hypothetical protein